jgi:hypothetical protein
MTRKYIDLSGKRFGRLLVLDEAEPQPRGNGYTHRAWQCRCNCGTIATVQQRTLTSGLTVSCGCYNRDNHTTHGRTGTRTYRTWINMRHRCYDKKDIGFPNYGGRGIRVCQRWRHSFENFLADMGECPPGNSLDRIDNDDDYSPSNCRWATPREQANHRRDNVIITFQGRTLTASEWASELGIFVGTIYKRIRAGWPPHEVLSPVRRRCST